MEKFTHRSCCECSRLSWRDEDIYISKNTNNLNLIIKPTCPYKVRWPFLPTLFPLLCKFSGHYLPFFSFLPPPTPPPAPAFPSNHKSLVIMYPGPFSYHFSPCFLSPFFLRVPICNIDWLTGHFPKQSPLPPKMGPSLLCDIGSGIGTQM